MKWAAVVKEMIESEGTNVKAFADKAGIPYTTFRSILDRGMLTTGIGNAFKICRALGITVEELEQIAEGEVGGINTMAAHHDGDEWTEEEEKEIERFKEFVRSRRGGRHDI